MKVTVGIKAYKHEKFLAQAIESALAQETDFPFEILIGEDFSPDRTREIAIEYAERYPDRIRLFLPPENIGRHRIVEELSLRAKGEFLAILDGDDYWTDPRKLQKQVDLFESDPRCNVCFTNAIVRHEAGAPDGLFTTKPGKASYSLEEYLAGDIHIFTSSVMYRLKPGLKLPAWFFQTGMADFPMHVLYAEGGTLGFINETTAVYRIHEGGLWSTTGGWSDAVTIKRNQTLIQIFEALERQLGAQYGPVLRQRMAEAWYDNVWRNQCLGKIGEMRRALLAARRTGVLPRSVSKKFVWKAWLIAFLPFAGKAWLARKPACEARP